MLQMVQEIGPLSLDARLWHSQAGGILWLQTELQVSEASAAIKLSPANATYISHLLNWYSEANLAPRALNSRDGGDAVDVVPLPSGTEYSEMCVRRAKGDQLQGDEHRLTEIEDLAPVEWLARWQLRSLEQLGHESVASQPPARRGFVGWLRGASDRATATASQGEDDEALEDIVEEAGKQSFFEEVEEPRKLEVRLAIPHCTILSCSPALSSSPVPDLCIEGGVQCQLSLATAREGSMANFMKAAWDADVSANLSSVAVLLGKEPLMLLRRSADVEVTLPKTVSDADDEEFFDVQSDIEETTDSALQEAAVTLRLHVARFGGSAGSSSLPWALRVRLKQEPFRFMLAPHSMHDALSMVVAVFRAATSCRRVSSPSDPCMNTNLVERDPKSPAAASDHLEAPPDASEALALDLDLDVAAPVFRWGLLPSGHVTIALGRLIFRTSSQQPPEQVSQPERCEWRKFSCFCQLTETSVTAQSEEAEEFRVYEPATMNLQAWRDAETNGWDFSLESPSVRWIVDPLFLKVAGQLPISLDHAISPLRDVMSQVLTDPGVSSANAEGTLAQSQEAKVPQEPGGKVHPKVHVKLSIATTQLVLYPASGHKVSLELDGILAQYSGYESRNDISGEVALCHLSCDSTVLVSFTRGASLQVRSADHHVNVRGGSTLIAVRWHEHPIREVLGAFYEAWEALAAGHEHVQGILPVGDSAGMFAKLWGAYVVHPIQARVKQKAAQRLAELVPGVEQGAEPDAGLAAQQDTEQESHKSNEDAECLQPRGSCSVEVVLFYEGLDIVFPGSEHREGPTDGPPVVQVGVNGAECSFRAFQSGDASAAVSLVAVTLELDGRRLLMPRRGEKLLKVNILHRSRVEPALSWTASWACPSSWFEHPVGHGCRFTKQLLHTWHSQIMPKLSVQKELRSFVGQVLREGGEDHLLHRKGKGGKGKGKGKGKGGKSKGKGKDKGKLARSGKGKAKSEQSGNAPVPLHGPRASRRVQRRQQRKDKKARRAHFFGGHRHAEAPEEEQNVRPDAPKAKKAQTGKAMKASSKRMRHMDDDDEITSEECQNAEGEEGKDGAGTEMADADEGSAPENMESEMEEDDAEVGSSDGSEQGENSTPGEHEQGRYIPPHLRGKQRQDTVQLQHLRQLRGILNRVSEGNLDPSCNELVQLLSKLVPSVGSATAAHEFAEALLQAAVGDPNISVLVLGCFAALVAACHVLLGPAFGAAALLKSAKTLKDRMAAAEENRGEKENEDNEEELHNPDARVAKNSIIFNMLLFSFGVLPGSVVFDIVRFVFARSASELSIDLSLAILRYGGRKLRSDCPDDFRAVLNFVTAEASNSRDKSDDGSEIKSRLDYLLRELADLKNNKVSFAVMDRFKQTQGWLQTAPLLAGKKVEEHALAVPFQLMQDEAPPNWPLQGGASTILAKSKRGTLADPLRDAAVAQRLTSELRQSLFVALMGAEDFQDAAERLSVAASAAKAGCVECCIVLFHCAIREKAPNAFYAHVAHALCGLPAPAGKRFSHGMKRAAVQHIQQAHTYGVRAAVCLAELCAAMMASNSVMLPVSIIRFMRFGGDTGDGGGSQGLRGILGLVLRHMVESLLQQVPESQISQLFAPLRKYEDVREGMLLILDGHVRPRLPSAAKNPILWDKFRAARKEVVTRSAMD
ncbi:Suppressor of glycerol defect protein 1 [Symbiodinium microadriaticum]|uniref:Suppressor of glycerol defect protein 1 n=1 Tax=Symbiodinium microadriaticum TaxID=2951 RepID=A0A1Q9D337_SYMMI|nr:Suppressor of glycerol defect protein 1 [Symbiodinium microadriaticum]